jgi:hypothetical protein
MKAKLLANTTKRRPLMVGCWKGFKSEKRGWIVVVAAFAVSAAEGNLASRSRLATANQISDHRRHAIVLAVKPVILDRHVLALNVAGFAEACVEGSQTVHIRIGRPTVEETRSPALPACEAARTVPGPAQQEVADSGTTAPFINIW